MKKEKRGAAVAKREEELGSCWWVCIGNIGQLNRFLIGGYLSKVGIGVTCYKGEVTEAKNERDAMMKSIIIGVQFCLEEAYVKEEELCIVVNDKSLVQWILGKDKTSWEHRFERNKARGLQHLFLDSKAAFKESKKFRYKERWTEFTVQNQDDWLYWQEDTCPALYCCLATSSLMAMPKGRRGQI
ncbi:hypothetical protein PIB30_015298 [Stylosanthes scabra]|uniref:RNase H type-1 domain-containing protein n=1 Tax=Stylosanthes scabra TaxID=79078 RepID=A0ABU6Z3L7_9FABA|nr:hypothetical protein [Stylosanthes scabra]